MSTALAVPLATLTAPTTDSVFGVLDDRERGPRFDRVPWFRTDKPFHMTGTWRCGINPASVTGLRGWECVHSTVLWSSDLDLAAIRAGELR